MTYAGHMPDGSSIQRHSAGPFYPYIIGMQDHELGKWFVMAPSGDVMHRTPDYDDACRCALGLAVDHGK